MDTIIEFNDSAFNHEVSKADILWAFDNPKYDGWFNEREHAMPCRSVFFHLLPKEENNG
jgi:hypothetical protein